ncbi:unnamed protein product [Arabis nemorensis]|uniref:CCHC-type domain-containing protein n=1 Tax=Arabis nemorensis TaxID=586526 RepID=A0A565B0A7_9BRAS|nr:unnamed protein product [Arabis nemorensis]
MRGSVSAVRQVTCFTCGALGHYATSCPTTHPVLRIPTARPSSTRPATGQYSEQQPVEEKLCSRCRLPRSPSP